MAITLSAITLPSGLVWSDEFDWTPIAQSSDYSLSGALIIQQTTKQAGRPITLMGQSGGRDHTAWISRSALLTLKTLLDGLTVANSATLTLHDARTFSVIALHDGDGPLDTEPMPCAASFLPASHDADYQYNLKALRLIEV